MTGEWIVFDFVDLEQGTVVESAELIGLLPDSRVK